MSALSLRSIRIDGGTQPSAEISQEAVSEYAADMQAGATFPPVVVFFDGAAHWLADGFHRYHAARAAGREDISAEVKPGTRRDAILYSVGANASHGQRRTNSDKRRAVGTLLADAEWSARSDRWIAERCGVSPDTVGRIRAELSESDSSAPRLGQDGKERKLPAKPAQAPDPEPHESEPDSEEAYATKPSAFTFEERERLRALARGEEPKAEPQAADEPADEPEEFRADVAGLRTFGAIGDVLDPVLRSWPEGESLQPLIDCFRQYLARLERMEKEIGSP